jgi:RNA polymerase sigma-70 factor (ECF subfamily)
MDAESDAALVAAVAAGDVDAFARLVGRHRDGFTRFAVRMLGSRADADDALQSAWMRAYRNIGSCRQPERFQAWLYQIVSNECRSFATRRGRRERRIAADEDALAHAAVDHPADAAAIRDEIQRALDQLPPEQREAFVLKYVEELSYEEMMEITGAGLSALKMRVKRACERLRTLLETAPRSDRHG